MTVNMPLKLLLDENLRDTRIWSAIAQHNAISDEALDVIRVGDRNGPALGIQDPDVIDWAASSGRIIIGLDKTTLPSHLANFRRAGKHSPGIVLLRSDLSVPEIVELLGLISYATEPGEWANTFRWIP